MANDNNFNFNFSKKDEPVNPTESKELTEASQSEAPINDAELTDNTSDDLENDTEADAGAVKKAVVTYVGNGIWRDAKGCSWARNDKPNTNIKATRSYDEADYEAREDLKFMVKYGEMRVSLV